MNETKVTIHGNVVTEPVVRETRTGGVFVTFRIASTPLRRTAEGKFVDGETSFYGVIAFNALGANIGASVHKGQPIVVEGKLSTREWQAADGQLRQSTEIDAEHVGHDLAWGRSRFERLSRAAALGHERLSEPEVAGALVALVDDDQQRPAGVDANGEVDPEVYPTDSSSSEPDPETDDYEVRSPLSA